MTFAWPWLLLLSPLPWLVYRWWPADRGGTTLFMPLLPAIENVQPLSGNRRLFSSVLPIWLLLLVAVARPQLVTIQVAVPVTHRDLMVAIDLSASMATRDMVKDGQRGSRLSVARAVVSDFLAQRRGDRVGLVVFGSQAYLHTPLTFDPLAINRALDTLDSGVVGDETALGDAITIATSHLRELPESQRLLILITDGENTAGRVTPQRAAWLAGREGVRIYVVAITPRPSGVGEEREEGINPMQRVAEQTGGRYYPAADTASLESLFQQIDRLEPAYRDNESHYQYRELFHWPLALALVAALLSLYGYGSGGREWSR